MRLFDTHIHIGKHPFNLSESLSQMDKAEIEISVKQMSKYLPG